MTDEIQPTRSPAIGLQKIGRVRRPIGIETIEFGRYGSGELSMEIIDREGTAYPTSIPGERLTVATVSLIPYGNPKPAYGCVWLKGWSENEGIPDALVAGGVVTLTGRSTSTGYGVIAVEGRLTDAALGVLKAQGGSVPV